MKEVNTVACPPLRYLFEKRRVELAQASAAGEKCMVGGCLPSRQEQRMFESYFRIELFWCRCKGDISDPM
jgi:hypothetical protein